MKLRVLLSKLKSYLNPNYDKIYFDDHHAKGYLKLCVEFL